MKALILSTLTLLTISSTSQAYVGRRTEYICQAGSAKIAVVSDTRRNDLNVVGQLNGESLDFWSDVSKTGRLMVLSDERNQVVVKLQRAGPYDGGQDTLPGSIKVGTGRAINLSCSLVLDDSID